MEALLVARQLLLLRLLLAALRLPLHDGWVSLMRGQASCRTWSALALGCMLVGSTPAATWGNREVLAQAGQAVLFSFCEGGWKMRPYSLAVGFDLSIRENLLSPRQLQLGTTAIDEAGGMTNPQTPLKERNPVVWSRG